eukprot:403332212
MKNYQQMSHDQMDKFFNIIHYKILQRQEMLNQLNNLFNQESNILNNPFSLKELETKTEIFVINQDLDSKTECLYFDNENYENTILRLKDENLIASDRLIETREMIKKYDASTQKWLNICRASEITFQEMNQRSSTLNNSLNLEKKDQIMKIHQRKTYLQQLDQMILDYDKDLEHIKEQQIDISGRCYLLQRRLQYLKLRSNELYKKRGYWKKRGVNNFQQLQKILLELVIPKVIEKQSLENQSKDYLQRIMIMQKSKGELIKQLDKIKQQDKLKQDLADSSQYLRRLAELNEKNKIRNEQVALLCKKSEQKLTHSHMTFLQLREKIHKQIRPRDQFFFMSQFQDLGSSSQNPLKLNGITNLSNNEVLRQMMKYERIIVSLMEQVSMTLPKMDKLLNYMELIPEKMTSSVQSFQVQRIQNDPDSFKIDSQTSDLDQQTLQAEEYELKICNGFSLKYSSLETIYHAFFGDNPLLHLQKSSTLFLRRKKTIRSIGMDMVKKQANILINSKRSQDFEVYFHTKRQTEKMRKEMQTEIKQIQKEKKNAKLNDVVQEALIQKIEKMQQKEIIKQEIEAQNAEQMLSQLKNLFANNQKIEENTFIKKKWEAQNLHQYRNVQEKYRNLKQKLEKNNAQDFKTDQFESNITLQAQKIKQKNFLSKVFNQRKSEATHKIDTIPNDISSNNKQEASHKSQLSINSTIKTINLVNKELISHSKTNSSPFLQLVNNPYHSNLVSARQTPLDSSTRNNLVGNFQSLKSARNLFQTNESQRSLSSSPQKEKTPANSQNQIKIQLQKTTNKQQSRQMHNTQSKFMKKSETVEKLTLPNIDHYTQNKSNFTQKITDRSDSTLRSLTNPLQQTIQPSILKTNPYSQNLNFTQSGFMKQNGSLTSRSIVKEILSSTNNQQMQHARSSSNFNFPKNSQKQHQDGKLLYKVMVKENNRKSIIQNLIAKSLKNQQSNNQQVQDGVLKREDNEMIIVSDIDI